MAGPAFRLPLVLGALTALGLTLLLWQTGPDYPTPVVGPRPPFASLRALQCCSPGPDLDARAITGRLVAVAGDLLTVDEGDGDHAFRIDAATTVTRGEGRVLVSDHDATRLRLGDLLWVSAEKQPDGSLLAGTVDVNGFITRDGFIAARGPDYIDVRLRQGRLSSEFDATPTRIWLDPAAQVQWLQPNGVKRSGQRSDLAVGSWLSFQGFIADDGSWVATLLWPGTNLPPQPRN